MLLGDSSADVEQEGIARTKRTEHGFSTLMIQRQNRWISLHKALIDYFMFYLVLFNDAASSSAHSVEW